MLLSLSPVVLAALSISVFSVDPCGKGIEANYEGCKTQHTADASPEDERGRPMWSWTSDQLRQRCATEFYRLDDGEVSSRFLIEQGARLEDKLTPRTCITG